MRPALDLELVKTFLTVIEAQGLKSAAEQLNKTPAAISQQIKRLEIAVGNRVLERNNRGISLTTAGEVLKEKGQQLMSLNYELLGDLRENELSGQLKFGAPTDYAPALLQKLLPIFQREFPKVSPKILLGPSRSLRPQVKSGTLDMAIVAREPDSVEGQHLWTEEIAWFGKSEESCGTRRFGVLSTDCILRDRALFDLNTHPKSSKLVLESTTVASLRDAVDAGFCQAFLPVSMSQGLQSAPENTERGSLKLSFCLIAGPRFDIDSIQRVVQKFKMALR
ncbi:MAG: LysR family transcriptional regulator [Pseudomonadota bacterium]